MLRRPGYAAVVMMTLGLGIGATTTIYSVVDAMLIRALPYRDAERLVVIGNTVQGQERADGREGLQQLETMSYANLADLRTRVNGLEDVAALERGGWMAQSEGNPPEILEVANVTEGFFELLSVKPQLGRVPVPEDYGGTGRGRGSWGALISYEGWQRRFGGDSTVVGKTVNLGAMFTIVGVLPRDFYQPAALVGSDVEFWIHLDPADRRYQDRLRRNLHVVARLEPRVTLADVRAELSAAQVQLVRDEPAANVARDGRPLGAGVNSLRDETIGSAARPMLIFLGAAVLLLVLASSNAANLILVRGLERSPELALRRAIGASRTRVVANLVLESASLALAAGAIGVGIAVAGVAIFRRVGPASLPRLDEVGVNPRVVLAGALLSLVVGIVIGIVPALRSSGADLLNNLRSSRHTVSFKGARFRIALAATQLALAVVLGIAASLLFRSFVEIRTQELGFKPANLVAFVLPFKKERPWEVWDRALEALRAIPGTRS
ncbi:MAG: ABC transporter permease, partial [Longimicrobiales bacterium]